MWFTKNKTQPLAITIQFLHVHGITEHYFSTIKYYEPPSFKSKPVSNLVAEFTEEVYNVSNYSFTNSR